MSFKEELLIKINELKVKVEKGEELSNDDIIALFLSSSLEEESK